MHHAALRAALGHVRQYSTAGLWLPAYTLQYTAEIERAPKLQASMLCAPEIMAEEMQTAKLSWADTNETA